MSPEFIVPDWPAPANVQARSTTRQGGTSHGAWAGFNLAMHVGDDPACVAENRALLRAVLPTEPLWLNQVHGIGCLLANQSSAENTADAMVAFSAAQVCAVMTADCLPVLFCNRSGTVVAAAHAGWRGLAAGVLENAVQQMRCRPEDILVWLGPAIGPAHFEVGTEVRDVFVNAAPEAAVAFIPHGEKWLCDIYILARQRLAALGDIAVYGGGLCTVSDARRFYSYRRDGMTGRMASLIWLV
jgi:polyphenol oxidase